MIHFVNGDDGLLTAPTYNANTDRLTLTANDKKPVCLSTVKYVEIQKSKWLVYLNPIIIIW